MGRTGPVGNELVLEKNPAGQFLLKILFGSSGMGEANFTDHVRLAGSQAILEASSFMAEG